MVTTKTSAAAFVLALTLIGQAIGQSENADETKEATVNGKEARTVFYDGSNVFSSIVNALLGEATIVSPLNNVVLQTPVIGFVLIYLLLLLVFYEYNSGAILGPARISADGGGSILNRGGLGVDEADLETAGSIVSSLNRASTKYQKMDDES
ncbi:uncharacterized protein LOC119593403 [Penaeus monodon]|uniref:uncharacterized protein LOC119593403 n=1 Tax=Penaeus monodon TaxID=6687 RepID=UPI0018A73822|nr:uncharacterized protein LOC119593403 [Penaeus monodon]